jgi:hypothetical protein
MGEGGSVAGEGVDPSGWEARRWRSGSAAGNSMARQWRSGRAGASIWWRIQCAATNGGGKWRGGGVLAEAKSRRDGGGDVAMRRRRGGCGPIYAEPNRGGRLSTIEFSRKFILFRSRDKYKYRNRDRDITYPKGKRWLSMKMCL